jgi:hypothetical protein
LVIALNNSEEWRLECEAKTWLRLIEQNGAAWWHREAKPRVLKKRGQAALNYITSEMNKHAKVYSAK